MQVKGTPGEVVWNDAIDKFHYLGSKRLSGHSLKYLVYQEGQVVAALSWDAGSMKLRVRDQYIGWSPEQLKTYRKYILNNSRFLLLPNKSRENMGSYIMAKAIKNLPKEWENNFGYRPWIVETFVDGRYFDGAIYKACNWIHIGQTSGFGKGTFYNYHGNIKEVYIYELKKNYRHLIGCEKKSYEPLHSPPKILTLLEDFKMMLRSENWVPGTIPDIDIDDNYMKELSTELESFHKRYSGCYSRKEQELHGMVYFSGLFSSLPRKSIEPIALTLSPNESVRGLQKFMKNSTWNDELMQTLHQTDLMSSIGDENGMITIDPSDIPKKGKESVGVSRQYCGSTGKTDNCQSGVFLGYTSEKGYGLFDSQLYMPKQWFEEDHAEKRKSTLVP